MSKRFVFTAVMTCLAVILANVPAYGQNSGAPVWTQVMNSGESVAYYLFDNHTPYLHEDTGSTGSPRPAGTTYGNQSHTPWQQARTTCQIHDNSPTGIYWGSTLSSTTVSNSLNNQYTYP